MSITFEEAAEQVKNFKTKPKDAELLQLYGLYKQATVGGNTSEAPSPFKFQAKAKWDAWNKYKQMLPDAAKGEYINLVQKLQSNDK